MDTLKKLLKEPAVYVIIIQICILIILIYPAFNGNRQQIVHTIITAPPAQNGTADNRKASTINKNSTTIPPAQNGTAEDRKASTLNKNSTTITQIDGYYTIAKEQSYVYIQKRCNGCPKLYFNQTQLLEIKRFLGSCFHETKCDTRGFTTNNLYCIVCNPSLKMTLSSLSFCVDFNGNLNCAFQGSYVFYSDLLYALYKFAL